jgi:hypothetical protein
MAAWLGKKAPSVNRLKGGKNLMGMSNQEIKDHYATTYPDRKAS